MNINKIISLFIVLLINMTHGYARGIYDKELPSKFRHECFEYASSYNFLKKDDAEYKIELNKKDTVAVKDGFLIPIIPYKITGVKFSYTTPSVTNLSYWNDDNIATFNEIDTEKTTEILLKFDKVLKRNTFGLKFNHSAQGYAPELFISKDGIKFSPVTFSSIYDFDIKVIRINFIQKFEPIKREKIKISELSFTEEKNINLMRVSGGGRIDFYSDYNCDDYINLDTIHVPFKIDINTPSIKLQLKKNPDYNPSVDTDSDADGLQDYEDNCIETFNPLQMDSDADGKGDKCSDIDNDGIVGSDDNCPTISNSDQQDINRNNIGDVCEFDKDKDGVFDSIDNCINTPNQFQHDIDRDGIGNLCDNCTYFNPDQKDLDENNIGDVCDAKEKMLAENDDDFDGLMNGKDNCPDVPNPDQNDGDDDSVGDACDNCKIIQNTNQYDFDKNDIGDICEDSDGDGIDGMQDNCMNVVNIDQKDSDNNGIGDLCEDKDNDRIWFAADNCPNIYNPKQKDIDEDGIGNACDENDSRVLESNKNLFTLLIVLVIGIFVGGIFMMMKKMNSNTEELTEKNDKTSKNTKLKPKTKKKITKKKGNHIGDELFESYTDRKKRENGED